MYALAGIVLTVMAVDGARTWIGPLDEAWLDLQQAIEWGPLTVVARLFDFVGSTYVTLPLRIVVTLWLASRTRWAALTTWVVAWAASDVSVGLLKNLYDRARPPGALVETSGFSFPSGHAIAGAVTAVALVIVLLPPGAHRRIWEVRAALFAFAMAMSRTYLRAHWLTDVVAGALIGAATAVATAAVVHLWRVRRFRRGLGPPPPVGPHEPALSIATVPDG